MLSRLLHILSLKIIVDQGLPLDGILLSTHWVKLTNQGVETSVELVGRGGIATTHAAHDDSVLLLAVGAGQSIWRLHVFLC